jgi:hypothetical protein
MGEFASRNAGKTGDLGGWTVSSTTHQGKRQADQIEGLVGKMAMHSTRKAVTGDSQMLYPGN